MTIKFSHIPVLARETIEFLRPIPNGTYIDCTLGGGGHAGLILSKLGPNGRLVGIDQDAEALSSARQHLKKYTSQTIFVADNFSNLDKIVSNLHLDPVDGILLDLGVSSYQLENPSRGFSFRDDDDHADTPLDMRMDQSASFSASDVVNKYDEKRLSDLIFRLGEEPYARAIARRIIENRVSKPIQTNNELLAIIKSATPPKYRFSRKHGHYASKVFRALRMEVNHELDVITTVIPQAINHLKSGGRLVIITFHSGEDRIVKHAFRDFASADNPSVLILTKKPILPTEAEIISNPKSSSAKLRVIEKI